MKDKKEQSSTEIWIKEGMHYGSGEIKVEIDNVEKPAHYNTGSIQPIDAIEDWKLGFNLGNSVKYIARAGKKDTTKTIEDLKKARWYLERELNNLKKLSVDNKK